MHKLPNIKAIVVYTLEKLPADLKDKRYYTWKDFLALGKDVKDDIIKDKVKIVYSNYFPKTFYSYRVKLIDVISFDSIFFK